MRGEGQVLIFPLNETPLSGRTFVNYCLQQFCILQLLVFKAQSTPGIALAFLEADAFCLCQL